MVSNYYQAMHLLVQLYMHLPIMAAKTLLSHAQPATHQIKCLQQNCQTLGFPSHVNDLEFVLVKFHSFPTALYLQFLCFCMGGSPVLERISYMPQTDVNSYLDESVLQRPLPSSLKS